MAKIYHFLLLFLASALATRNNNQGIYDILIHSNVLAFVPYGSGPGGTTHYILVYEGPYNNKTDMFYSTNK